MTTTTEEQVMYGNLTNAFPAFEGAASTYRTGLRGLFDGSADALAARELRYLQNRSAHLCRNNGYARTALKKWTTNADHIKTVWKNKDGSIHTLMQSYWDEFVKNPSFDGVGDLRVFQGVSNSALFTTGNSYIRKLIIRDGNDNTVPLKLQLIPSALHDIMYSDAYNLTSSTKVTRYGMTFDKSVPIAYHFKGNPLETKPLDSASMLRVTVPAEEIIHTFVREEPGQWLGIPMLASIILSLYELDDLITATVSKQKAAQSIAVLVEQTGNTIAQLPVGGHLLVDSNNNEVPDGKKVVFKSNSKESQVLYLNKGESAKMFQGTDIGNNFGTLVESELRKIAATLDLAYHELTGNTTGLNYSSLIGLSILSRNRLEYLHNFLFIPLRDKPIADAFKALAVVYNSKTASAIPYFQLPRWRGIDELKDAQADLLEVQNGFGLISDKLAERGISKEELLADLELRKEFEPYGIILNTAGSNPSMNQANNTQANSNTTST